jgi:hypothetical protein
MIPPPLIPPIHKVMPPRVEDVARAVANLMVPYNRDLKVDRKKISDVSNFSLAVMMARSNKVIRLMVQVGKQ